MLFDNQSKWLVVDFIASDMHPLNIEDRACT